MPLSLLSSCAFMCDSFHDYGRDFQIPTTASEDGNLVIVTTATAALASKAGNNSLCNINNGERGVETRAWLYPDNAAYIFATSLARSTANDDNSLSSRAKYSEDLIVISMSSPAP